MQCCARRLHSTVVPHIHRAVGCPVCSLSSTTSAADSSSHNHDANNMNGLSQSNSPRQMQIPSLSIPVRPTQEKEPHLTLLSQPSSSSTSALSHQLSVEELRREGLRQWMLQFGKNNEHADWCENNLREKSVFSLEHASLLVRYLDSKCSRTLCNDTVPKEERIRIPSSMYIPIEHTLPQSLLEKGTPSTRSGKNAFLSVIRNAEDLEKQLKFQKALLDVQIAFRQVQLQFFLACGTALGAHREKMFIPHDDDIDLGIMLDSLEDLGKRSSRWCESYERSFSKRILPDRNNTYTDNILRNANEEESTDFSTKFQTEGTYVDAVNGVISLVSALSNVSGGIVLFDICGEVSKGLELRVLHTETGVRIDINVYYPPIAGEDDYLVQQHGDFVWASSFYEDAMQRKHAMYRFLHKPFKESLIQIPFCAREPELLDNHFLVPPELYLDEYFGADWKTPKRFSYAEGLRNEYANIIDE